MRLMFITPASRTPRASVWLILFASVWMAVLGNLPLWQTLWHLPELKGWSGPWLIVGFALMIASALASLLALLAWRWTLQPAITLLMLLCAFASHYMWQYGIVVDTPMLINVLQTDAHEARDQLSLSLLLNVLFLAVLPAGWVWQRPLQTVAWTRQALRNLGLFVTSLVLLLSLIHI